MKWEPGETSENIEDRRAETGEGGGRRIGGIHVGIGGTIVLLVLSVVFKQNFFALLDPGASNGGNSAPVSQLSPEQQAEQDRLVKFVSFVLDSVQNTWTRVLPASGAQYRPAKLVLFRDGIDSACGLAESATGPFYCPGDEKVYLDLGFYDELRDRFGAPGDFAQAYVLAHELGHHVQKILGIEARMREQQRESPDEANALSVRLELQADCLAGIWGHETADQKILDPGDIEEGLQAASSVGDDRLQRMATGHVNPDGFTHGTSAQRSRWFKRGFDSGEVKQCDTFASRAL